MTVFPTHFYTSNREISTLSYTSSLKKDPFWVEPPRIVHYREYPLGPNGTVSATLMCTLKVLITGTSPRDYYVPATSSCEQLQGTSRFISPLVCAEGLKRQKLFDSIFQRTNNLINLNF